MELELSVTDASILSLICSFDSKSGRLVDQYDKKIFMGYLAKILSIFQITELKNQLNLI